MLKRRQKKLDEPGQEQVFKEPSLWLRIANRYLKWIIVLVMGVVLFLSYSLVLSPQVHAVQRAAEESLPAKRKILRDLQAIKQELDGIVLDFERLKQDKQTEFEKLNVLLPRGSEYEKIFTLLDDITTRSGLKLTSISIAFSEGAAQRAPEPAFQEVKPGAPQVDASAVQKMVININVSGGNYETLKQYLDAIERNIRLLDVSSLSFDGSAFAAAADEKERTMTTASFAIELVTYYTSSEQPQQ